MSTNIGRLTVYYCLTSADEVTNLMIWTGAEISSLIMAASVPFIRLFVKSKLSTSKRSHTGGDQGLDGHSQEKAITCSSPTTVESDSPGWRAQSGDFDLVADNPHEIAVNSGALSPHT